MQVKVAKLRNARALKKEGRVLKIAWEEPRSSWLMDVFNGGEQNLI